MTHKIRASAAVGEYSYCKAYACGRYSCTGTGYTVLYLVSYGFKRTVPCTRKAWPNTALYFVWWAARPRAVEDRDRSDFGLKTVHSPPERSPHYDKAVVPKNIFSAY